MAFFDRKDDYLYIRWAAEVKRRDHWACTICSSRGELNSHHIFSWDVHVEYRYDLDWGTTLCKSCHEQFHNIYGRGNNDDKQFAEFVALTEGFIKAGKKVCVVKHASQYLDGYCETESLIEQMLKDLDGYK